MLQEESLYIACVIKNGYQTKSRLWDVTHPLSDPSLCPPTPHKGMILPVVEDGKLDFQMHFLTPAPTPPRGKKKLLWTGAVWLNPEIPTRSDLSMVTHMRKKKSLLFWFFLNKIPVWKEIHLEICPGFPHTYLRKDPTVVKGGPTQPLSKKFWK